MMSELPLESPAPWPVETDDVDPPAAKVYTSKNPGESSAFVTLLDQDDRPMCLTPLEAKALAEQLNHFAWVAEQGGRERNAFELGRDYERIER